MLHSCQQLRLGATNPAAVQRHAAGVANSTAMLESWGQPPTLETRELRLRAFFGAYLMSSRCVHAHTQYWGDGPDALECRDVHAGAAECVVRVRSAITFMPRGCRYSQ